MEQGKNAFNDQIVPRQSIALTWRPISQREKYDNPYQEVDPQQKHYYNRILEYLQQILDSNEAPDYLDELLETELEIPLIIYKIFMNSFQLKKQNIYLILNL